MLLPCQVVFIDRDPYLNRPGIGSIGVATKCVDGDYFVKDIRDLKSDGTFTDVGAWGNNGSGIWVDGSTIAPFNDPGLYFLPVRQCFDHSYFNDDETDYLYWQRSVWRWLSNVIFDLSSGDDYQMDRYLGSLRRSINRLRNSQ